MGSVPSGSDAWGFGMPTTVAEAQAGEAGTSRREPAGRPARHVSRRVASDVVEALDALAVLAGTLMAGVVAAQFDIGPGATAALVVAGLLAALVAAAIGAGGADRDPLRLATLRAASVRRTLAHIVAHAAVVVLLLTPSATVTTALAMLAAAIATSLGSSIALRLGARRVLRHLSDHGAFDTRVAVYGSGLVAARVAAHLADGRLAIAYAGRWDDRAEPRVRPDEASAVARGDGVPAPVGSLDGLVAAARAGTIDQIVLALPQSAVGRTEQILRRLDHLAVRISIVTHIASDILPPGPAHRVAALGPVGLLTVKSRPLDGWGTVLKTVEDYVLGSIALVLALPVMALVAVAVKLDSPGPVLFRQRRRGLNGAVFEVLKFRTMRVLEDGGTVTQATRGDPRVTRVGRFLRASSLDELPQLINVLRGEMSLVGPRPHAVAHDDRYAEEIRRYPSRQQVKPGITGLAQVRGHRGETETPEKMQARVDQDLAYVESWSLWLDLRILALTVVKAWGGRNAY